MTERPLLLLPSPTSAERANQTGGGDPPPLPEKSRQVGRVGPKLDALRAAFEAQRAELAADPAGLVPEQVLVIEVAGSLAEFRSAAIKAGLEWLGEFDEDTVSANSEFQEATAEIAEPVPGRLFLTMANEQAMSELERLWVLYRDGREFPHGWKKWSHLFAQLSDVRRWGVRDRLNEAGVLDDWRARVAAGAERVLTEVELWYRDDPAARERSKIRITQLIGEVAGRVVSECVIEPIAYQAVLAELPIAEIRQIVDSPDTKLTRCDQVMLFRPSGQAVFRGPTDHADLATTEAGTFPPPTSPPVAALLDGLPLSRHALLDGRLTIDDPDGFDATHPPAQREHGTAMASVIVHGDLGNATRAAIRSTLYVRPILQPTPGTVSAEERVPADRLFVDLLHRAVQRLFEPAGQGAAPSVRIVNLSIGDPGWQFLNGMSPCARLLDWLAVKYSVLFVVSAGNQVRDLEMTHDRAAFSALDPQEQQLEVLRALARDLRNRSVLAPAEALNALTVGAAHDDASPLPVPGALRDPLVLRDLVSPLSALGFGPRRSVKPDVLAAGGRQPYFESVVPGPMVLKINRIARQPGVGHACPSPVAGQLNATRMSRGTSNASALVTHYLVRTHEELELVVGGLDPQGRPADRHTATLLRAAAVHSASWGPEAVEALDRALRDSGNSKRFKDVVARFLGFGSIAPGRMLECGPERATALGWGDLEADQAHLYRVPLPPALADRRLWRRVTVTLACASPINPRHRNYRRAAMWATVDGDHLAVRRQQVDAKTAQRGTVQHEVWEGERATTFPDGAFITVQVNCREDGGALAGAVPYALVVSLEVAEGIDVPVYEQVRDRVRVPVQVAPAP